MLRYIESPNALAAISKPVVFLAGRTSGPDWQRDVYARLEAERRLADVDCTILNPRRPYDDSSRQQIEWEWNALRIADIRLFWFMPSDSANALQPMTLFELGRWSSQPGDLIVAVDPLYARAADVILQLTLERPSLSVQSSLDDAVQILVRRLAAMYHATAARRNTEVHHA